MGVLCTRLLDIGEVVLMGAVVMRFTYISILDPLMSMGIAVFILINTVKNIKELLDLFLEKHPRTWMWSMNEPQHYATMHVVTDEPGGEIKKKIREELKEHGIVHVALELESGTEICTEDHCHVEVHHHGGHHHHHHHH